MEAIIYSTLLVAAAEMGDKTQLIALVLAYKYKKPWTICLGIFVATLLNHFMAAYIGEWATRFFDPQVLKWTLFSIFIGFGLWILIPDKEEKIDSKNRYGVFLTTAVIFFWAEMGDKTQFATIAMAARFQNVVLVTIGTTLGMMISNGLAVFLGNRLNRVANFKWIRIFASCLFLIFAVLILLV